jgi:hypothetical protein
MNKLQFTLIKIANDFENMDKILMEDYKTIDLLQVWENVINEAPKELNHNWDNLMGALQAVLKLKYTNFNTFNKMVSKFRKPIREIHNDKIYERSKIILGRNQAEAEQQKKDYKNKVESRNNERATLPALYVNDVIKVMKKLIKSTDPYELALCVELATASRSIEIFKISKYIEIENQPNKIKIIGIAKDTFNKKFDFDNIVLIRNLVHLNSKQVIKAVNYIRLNLTTDINNMSNDDISKLTNKKINKVFDKYIKPLFVPQDPAYLNTLTSHKSRYISGYISYLLYGKPNKIPEETYIQSQLAHVSPQSTKSYLNINIFLKKTDNKKKSVIKFSNFIEKEKKVAVVNFPVEINEFKNKLGLTEQQKINNVKNALKVLLPLKIKFNQKQLKKYLGYSSKIMSDGYVIIKS